MANSDYNNGKNNAAQNKGMPSPSSFSNDQARKDHAAGHNHQKQQDAQKKK